MKKNVLKIDLDLDSREEAIKTIVERMRYFKNLFGVDYKYWYKIELLRKTKYSARIHILKPVKDERSIIILQLVFGSDWRKELNTFYNSEVLKMEYSNRLFTIKNYNDRFLEAEIEDITDEARARATSPVIHSLSRLIISKIKKWLR